MPDTGASEAGLEELQRTFAKERDQVDTLKANLTNAVGNMDWVGRAASDFENAWNTQFSPALTKLWEALDGAEREVGIRLQRLRDFDATT